MRNNFMNNVINFKIFNNDTYINHCAKNFVFCNKMEATY